MLLPLLQEHGRLCYDEKNQTKQRRIKMQYTFKTKGVCSRSIVIDMEGDMIRKVEFIGGCPGNTQGVARLSENRPIDEVISIVDGIHCGPKPTSCPDQLAQALKQIKAEAGL
jgi:uncharacterized protein (TIGR03905 family)